MADWVTGGATVVVLGMLVWGARSRSPKALELTGERIDVNRATVDDWLKLPLVSIHQAKALVRLRKAGVQLHSTEDLAAVLGIPAQKLTPLKNHLRFCYYDPDSVYTAHPMAVNQAELANLEKFLGLPLAKAMVEERQTGGPFRNWEDLQTRLGLSGPLVSTLLPYLYFDD